MNSRFLFTTLLILAAHLSTSCRTEPSPSKGGSVRVSLGESPSVVVDAPENQQKPATTEVYEKVTRKFVPLPQSLAPSVGSLLNMGTSINAVPISVPELSNSLAESSNPQNLSLATPQPTRAYTPYSLTHSTIIEETIERRSEASTGSSWEQKLDQALAAVKRASILTWSGVVLLLGAGVALYRGWPLPAAFFAGAGGMVIYDQNWLWLLLIVGAIAVAYAWHRGHFDGDEKAGTN
jgi:hypothetical protein